MGNYCLRRDAEKKVAEARELWEDAKKKEERAAEAPKAAEKAYRNAEQLMQKVLQERDAMDKLKAKMHELGLEEKLVQARLDQAKQSLAEVEKRIEGERAKGVELERLRAQKRREVDDALKKLAAEERRLEASRHQLEANEKEVKDALNTLRAVQKTVQQGLGSSSKDTRIRTAWALRNAAHPLVTPRACYDLWSAMLRETDAKVEEAFLTNLQALDEELFGLTGNLYPVRKDFPDTPTLFTILENIRARGKRSLGIAPLLYQHLERTAETYTRRTGQLSGRVERIMRTLAETAPEDPEAVQAIARALSIRLPGPVDFAYFAYYKAGADALSCIYRENGELRAPVVASLQRLLAHQEPRVVRTAVKSLIDLCPLPQQSVEGLRQALALAERRADTNLQTEIRQLSDQLGD